ncbi:MAG: hypothetical protein JSU04_18660 [Bdellovibrionales bacterium]|nr:hypothetical protein [Bdellovibrionales bacterium]
MKKMIFFVLLISAQSFAGTVKQSIQGTGLDGKPCAVSITRDGDKLIDVQLTGASEVFQILADVGSSVRPKTEMRPDGGREIFPANDPAAFGLFTHSNDLLGSGETFNLDSNDIPGDNPFKGVKILSAIQLKYDGRELVEVRAATKAKGLGLVTLGSSKFSCAK